MEQETLILGADGTEVIWSAELTKAMIRHLSPYEISALCEELSDTITKACEDYEAVN